MNTFKAIIIRNWKMNLRNLPVVFIVSRIMSITYRILGAWLMYYIFFEQQLAAEFYLATNTDDYMSFVVIGLAFYNLAVGLLMNVSRSLITEVRENTLTSLFITPYSKIGYFLGVFTEQVVRLLLEFMIILLIGALFGAAIFQISIISWLIGIIIVLVFVGSMTLLLSNLFLHFRDTFMTQNTLFILMMLICGVAFPVQFLPVGLQYLSHIIPLTGALNIFRALVFENATLLEVMPDIWQGLLISILYLVIGMIFYQKTERKVIGYVFD